MNKDELINRALLLNAALQSAVQDNERASATINEVDEIVLIEAAQYFGATVNPPQEGSPYSFFEMRGSKNTKVTVWSKKIN